MLDARSDPVVRDPVRKKILPYRQRFLLAVYLIPPTARRSRSPTVRLSISDSFAVKELEGYDYVRSSVVTTTDRQGDLQFRSQGDYYTTIGYSELDEGAPAAMAAGDTPQFRRRVFWLKNPDRPLDGDPGWDNKAPAEAVDPRTVEPGVSGEATERAQGRLVDGK